MKEIFLNENNELLNKSEWDLLIDNLKKQVKDSNEKIESVELIAQKLQEAVLRRVPKDKEGNYESAGVLFSGGVDSTIIAKILFDNKIDVTCYTVGFQDEDTKMADDVIESKKIARMLGLKQKIILLNFDEAHELFKKTAQIIKKENANVVNIGVAGVEVAALEKATKEDPQIKTFFGGLGSEEIFAGYNRHLKADSITDESWVGMHTTYIRDLKRDFNVATHFKVGFATPFLDEELIITAMKVPENLKINDIERKYILRAASEHLGLPHKFAFRPKKAAQYGSRLNNAMQKLAVRLGLDDKKEYVEKLYE